MQKIFETRKATIKRKALELSSRCDSEVCVLSFGPDGRFDQWPEDPAKAAAVIRKYRTAAARMGGKSKRGENLNLSDMLDAKIKALRRQIDAGRRIPAAAAEGGIRASGFSLWDEELALLPKESLVSLSRCLDSRIQAINSRLESLASKPVTMDLGFSEQESSFTDEHIFEDLQEPNADYWPTMNQTVWDIDFEGFGGKQFFCLVTKFPVH